MKKLVFYNTPPAYSESFFLLHEFIENYADRLGVLDGVAYRLEGENYYCYNTKTSHVIKRIEQ